MEQRSQRFFQRGMVRSHLRNFIKGAGRPIAITKHSSSIQLRFTWLNQPLSLPLASARTRKLVVSAFVSLSIAKFLSTVSYQKTIDVVVANPSVSYPRLDGGRIQQIRTTVLRFATRGYTYRRLRRSFLILDNAHRDKYRDADNGLRVDIW